MQELPDLPPLPQLPSPTATAAPPPPLVQRHGLRRLWRALQPEHISLLVGSHGGEYAEGMRLRYSLATRCFTAWDERRGREYRMPGETDPWWDDVRCEASDFMRDVYRAKGVPMTAASRLWPRVVDFMEALHPGEGDRLLACTGFRCKFEPFSVATTAGRTATEIVREDLARHLQLLYLGTLKKSPSLELWPYDDFMVGELGLPRVVGRFLRALRTEEPVYRGYFAGTFNHRLLRSVLEYWATRYNRTDPLMRHCYVPVYLGPSMRVPSLSSEYPKPLRTRVAKFFALIKSHLRGAVPPPSQQPTYSSSPPSRQLKPLR